MKEVKVKKFAEGLCYDKLFWIFVIGSIFGALYEEILTCIQTLYKTGIFEWVYRRGVIYGPFSPIYGAGAVLMAVFLIRPKMNKIKVFFYGAFLGGAFEYLVSILQEVFIGTSSWDYSNQFLSINGRTTIPIMVVWGILALSFVYIIYPLICKCLEKFSISIGKKVTIICSVLLAINMLVSWTALFRQTMRRNGIDPFTPVGELYDKVYTDEYLSKYFTNMVPVKRGK